MTYECRIYPHPSILRNCSNCRDLRTTSKHKVITSTKCARYNQNVDFCSVLNGRYPDFCKLFGENGIDRNRIYPDPTIVYCCANCPANRRDPNFSEDEIPLKYKCFEYDLPLTLEDFERAMDGIYPSFCKLEKVKK